MFLTAVVLAKNEEKSIEHTLSSLEAADEILVVDDDSTDRTPEVAKKHRAIVFKKSSEGDFAAQRNFAFSKAQGEWVLFVDADEVLSRDLVQEIQKTLKNPAFDTYRIRRRDFWWGTELKHGEVRKARTRGFIRLVKKSSGVFKGRVHEIFVTLSKSGILKNFIDHYPHPTLKDFISDINYYSTLQAKELYEKKRNVSTLEIIIVPISKFLYTYFLLLGFLDGYRGFVYSFLMSFHSFLVRAKLYQYQALTLHD